MTTKVKVLILNFLAFAILFLIFRFGLGAAISMNSMLTSLIAAVLASVLAPKFAEVKERNGNKILMKWIFMKGFKEI